MSPEENTQDTSGGTGPTDAPTQAADAAPTDAAPPQVQADQVPGQTAQNDPTDSPSTAQADQLASDGDAVREGVQEEGGQTNAS